MKRLLCRLFGHRYIVLFARLAEHTAWGGLQCTRCGHGEPWQWDE
jgi:hypothetical protein